MGDSVGCPELNYLTPLDLSFLIFKGEIMNPTKENCYESIFKEGSTVLGPI